jgi:hypothetical protein
MPAQTATAFALFAALSSSLALAEPAGLPKEPLKEIPKQLEPWVPWVLHGAEAMRCPFLAGSTGGNEAGNGEVTTNCLWPSRMTVQVGDKSGTFEQQWRVFDARGGWVPLPGDEKAWPQDVRIDGVAAVISDHEGAPRVHVPAGEHRVSGGFAWSSQPEALQLPAQTGLLALTLRGKAVDIPEWDESGKLWLGERVQVEDKPEEDRLVVNVVRRLEDEIPAVVTTQLQLAVSGKNREVVIGPALLPGFTATYLQSTLPVRLEADGRVRIQLRPGDWTVDLAARSSGPVAALSEPKVPAPWADETVWAFSADDELRQATIEGVPAVDPQQTRLPNEWKNLPAYRMRAGDTLKLVQGRRGDAEPPPDALSLQRELWLDSDGHGYTVHDQLAGELHKDWRLDASPQLELGRVAVAGRDQFITRVGADGPIGVEIRQGELAVEADSRVEGDVDRLPAVGWRRDFKSVTEQLNLPPGWRLFHATGVDAVSQTWLSSWALVDICLLIIAALAAGKLFGWGWGLAALLALGLCHHESGAPHALWLVAIGLAALARVLPVGNFRKAAELVRLGAGALLVIALALFAVRQLRQAAFPVLEEVGEETSSLELAEATLPSFAYAPQPAAPASVRILSGDAKKAPNHEKTRSAGLKSGLLGALGGHAGAADKNMNAFGADGDQLLAPQGTALGLGGLGSGVNGALPPPAASPAAPKDAELSYTLETDPNAQLQTGPGLTSWGWRSVQLSFNGPVEAAQEIRLYLIPPWLERLLSVLRVAMCVLLAFCVLGLRKLSSGGPAAPGRRPGLTVTAVGALLLLASAGAARAAEPTTTGVIDEVSQRLLERKFPDPAMLDQLKERLLKKPSCAPNCVSLQRMKLTASGHRLAIDLELSSAADTAAPVPGDAKNWRPSEVSVDAHAAAALWRDDEGTLWVQVTPGLHKIALTGSLPPHDSVQLALPMKPHFTVAETHGWTVEGLQDDGEVDDQLQLSRVAKPPIGLATEGEPDGDSALEPNELPGFAMVTRTLQLGVLWTVHTEVTRQTPQSSALVMAVPLLQGESVTSSDIHVLNGKVQVNLAAGQSVMAWDAVLKPSATFELAAPSDVAWVEDWRLDASPIWRAEATGIPVIHGEDGSGHRLLEWRPWPGEKVTLRTSRPAGVPGSTLTVDKSALTVTPGLRSTETQLVLQLRSSRAGEHEVLLPSGATLTSLVIDGVTKPLHQSGQKVTVPLKPGTESVALSWTEKHGPGVVLTAPAIDLGAPSVNAWTDVRLANRWLLYAGGPGAMMGPVFLIWAVVFLLLLAAIALSRFRVAPLGTLGWFALGLGFTQGPLEAGVVFAGFLVALGLSRRKAIEDDRLYNARQLVLAAGALFTVFALFAAVKTALAGHQEMLLTGNASGGELLRWYQDRSGALLPQPWVLSTPLWVYRAAMLSWAGWLALTCARLAPWAWGSFAGAGVWRGGGKLQPSTEPNV